MLIRHCFIPVIPDFWLWQLSVPSSTTVPVPWKGWYRCPNCDIHFFSTLQHILSFCIYHVPNAKRGFLWLDLRTALIYGWKDTNLHGTMSTQQNNGNSLTSRGLWTPQLRVLGQVYSTNHIFPPVKVGLKFNKEAISYPLNNYPFIAPLNISHHYSHYGSELSKTFDGIFFFI